MYGSTNYSNYYGSELSFFQSQLFEEITLPLITITARKQEQEEKLERFINRMYADWFHPTLTRIDIYRFAYTDKSTISRFSIVGSFIKGYFLEPAQGTDKEATTEGSKKAIQAGTYLAVPHTSNKENLGKVMMLLNVQGRSSVYIHKGNKPGETIGCLMPGKNWKQDYVGPSEPILEEIFNYTGRYAIISIQDAPWSTWK